MATDIMGLFADLDPAARMMQQQQRFQQQLSQSVTPQQFIATVGTNLGSQLGQAAQQFGLFGAPSQSPQEQRAAKRLEALQAAAASGVDQTDGVAFVREVQKQLRMRGLDAEALALENQAQDYIKTQAYVRQTETGKKDKFSTPKALDVTDPNYTLLYDSGVRYTRSVTKADGTVDIEYLDARGKKVDVFGGTPTVTETALPEGNTPEAALARKEAERKAREAAQKQSSIQQEQQAEQQVQAGVPGVTSTDWALSGMSGMNERPMTFPVTPQSPVIGNILAPYNKPQSFETGGLLTPPGY